MFNFKFRLKNKRRRRKRRRGRHIFSFFSSRKKKFNLYFIPFDSKLINKNYAIGKGLSYGTRVGIKSLKLKLVNVDCLKSLKFCNQRILKSVYLEKAFKEVIPIVPDYFLTAKPKSIRMGKGKGESTYKVFFLKKNVTVYSLKFIFSYFKKFFIAKKFNIFKINVFVYFLLNTLKSKPSFLNKNYKRIY